MVQLHTCQAPHSNRNMLYDANDATTRKHGLLRKVKTNKPKYFVLHSESATSPARLEYYDSKKMWENCKKAKRIILLKNCFSVNPFSDAKVKHGLTLFMRDSCFQMSFDTEPLRDGWLNAIKAAKEERYYDEKPAYQHVWNVKVRARDLGKTYEGEYRLCLNDWQIVLVKRMMLEATLVLPLEVIRRCGSTGCLLSFEVGRQAMTGAGELWMEVEDALIAQHVHQAIIANANRSMDSDDFRPASSSFSEYGCDSYRRIRNEKNERSRSCFFQSAALYTANEYIAAQRQRSDSMESSLTSSSASVDELTPLTGETSSRSVTPDPRSSQRSSPYADMSRHVSDEQQSLSSGSVNSWSSADIRCDDVYSEMSFGGHHRSAGVGRHASKSSVDFAKGIRGKTGADAYIDMSAGQICDSHSNAYYDLKVHEKESVYIDMCGKHTANKGATVASPLKPDTVKSYLTDDTTCSTASSCSGCKFHNVESKGNSEPYVEMSRTEKDRCCSPRIPPHSSPSNPDLCSQRALSPADTFMLLEFDDRQRAASFTHRPRGSSWSQLFRPRSQSHGHKQRPPRKISKNSSKDSVASSCSDHAAKGGSQDGYMVMSPSATEIRDAIKGQAKSNVVAGSFASEDNKENVTPKRQPSLKHIIREPFPELSCSSEDDCERTVTADKCLSTRVAVLSSLDSEPYVDVQPISCHDLVQSISNRLQRPSRIASFIKDDTAVRSNGLTIQGSPPAYSGDYMRMHSSVSPVRQSHLDHKVERLKTTSTVMACQSNLDNPYALMDPRV